MKRNLVTLLLALAMVSPAAAFAAEDTNVTTSAPAGTEEAVEEAVMTDVFTKSEEFGGYIDSNNSLVLNISDDTVIVDEAGNTVSKDELDGKILEVHYSFATMSLPAQTNPTKIVVKEAKAPEESVMTAIFVKSNDFGDYIDVNNTLALNISDDTEIVDEEGNAVSKDDLHLSTLEVHYGATTMSIPAQTTPTKIVVKNVPKAQAGDLAKENVAVFTKGETEYTSEYTVKEEKNYVPFRDVAEGLGINVIWSDADRSITLEDNDVTTNTKVDGNADLLLENGSTFVITNALEKYFGGFGVTVELR